MNGAELVNRKQRIGRFSARVDFEKCSVSQDLEDGPTHGARPTPADINPRQFRN